MSYMGFSVFLFSELGWISFFLGLLSINDFELHGFLCFSVFGNGSDQIFLWVCSISMVFGLSVLYLRGFEF